MKRGSYVRRRLEVVFNSIMTQNMTFLEIENKICSLITTICESEIEAECISSYYDALTLFREVFVHPSFSEEHKLEFVAKHLTSLASYDLENTQKAHIIINTLESMRENCNFKSSRLKATLLRFDVELCIKNQLKIYQNAIEFILDPIDSIKRLAGLQSLLVRSCLFKCKNRYNCNLISSIFLSH